MLGLHEGGPGTGTSTLPMALYGTRRGPGHKRRGRGKDYSPYTLPAIRGLLELSPVLEPSLYSPPDFLYSVLCSLSGQSYLFPDFLETLPV